MSSIPVAAKLGRATFRTSRLLDFASEKELTAQTGHPSSEWPLVIIKELVDNALDACEEAGIAPEIAVRVGAHGITVSDNGPGLPAKVVEDILDFSVRVSSREAYVSPSRGAQGNALKTIVAMPFVLNRKAGRRHERRNGFVKTGTRVAMRWPSSAMTGCCRMGSTAKVILWRTPQASTSTLGQSCAMRRRAFYKSSPASNGSTRTSRSPANGSLRR